MRTVWATKDRGVKKRRVNNLRAQKSRMQSLVLCSIAMTRQFSYFRCYILITNFESRRHSVLSVMLQKDISDVRAWIHLSASFGYGFFHVFVPTHKTSTIVNKYSWFSIMSCLCCGKRGGEVQLTLRKEHWTLQSCFTSELLFSDYTLETIYLEMTAIKHV